MGIRHIDTAHAYQNEHSVGKAVSRAVQEGIVKRQDVWVTSAAIDKTHDCHDIGYIDLLLLHQ